MLRTIVISILLLVFMSGSPIAPKAHAANFTALFEAFSLLFTDYSDYKETMKSNFTFGFMESSACNTQDKYAVMAAQRDILNFLITHYRGITDEQLNQFLKTYRKYELELVFLDQADTINKYLISQDPDQKAKLRSQVTSNLIRSKVISSQVLINQYFEDFIQKYRARFDESPQVRGEYATCEGPYQEVKEKINRLKELVQLSRLGKSLQSKWTLVNRKFDNMNIQEHYKKIYDQDMKDIKNLFGSEQDSSKKQDFSKRAKPFFDYQEVLDRFKSDQINKNSALSRGLVVNSEKLLFDKIIASDSERALQKTLDANFDITEVQTALRQQEQDAQNQENLQERIAKEQSELFFKGNYSLQSLLKYKETTAFAKKIHATVEKSQNTLKRIDKKQCQ